MRGCHVASVVGLSVALVGVMEAQRPQPAIPRTVPSVTPGPVDVLTIDREALLALLAAYDTGDYTTFDQRATRFSRTKKAA